MFSLHIFSAVAVLLAFVSHVGVTPGCVQPSPTAVIHVYTRNSTREEAVCWQGLEYSPFPLCFTPEGSSVQSLAMGAPLSPWSHSPMSQPVPALMSLGWDFNAVPAKRLCPPSCFPLIRSSRKKCGGEYLSVQAEPLCGIFRSAGVRVEHLGCGQRFTSLPAAHKFPPKTLSVY